jgi:uncharacterized protein YbjT (DUF2867 family)
MPVPDHLRIILTGATGMVGEGVLLECLDSPAVEHVLMINRRPSPQRHAKLSELIVPNFLDIDRFTDHLGGYDACFFCAGVSSRGMTEILYNQLTYETTLRFAKALCAVNPHMTFIYVSGALTDSTEKGRLMWARIKGRTENALLRCGFDRAYNFRPGFMRPRMGQRNVHGYYRVIGPLYLLLRLFAPHHVSTMRQVGRAMINAVAKGYPNPVLEIRDINTLAAV